MLVWPSRLGCVELSHNRFRNAVQRRVEKMLSVPAHSQPIVMLSGAPPSRIDDHTNGAKPKHPENVSGIHVASRRSHELHGENSLKW